MLELAYVTADVFTTEPFGGNPLAVFTDAAGLDAALMQRIARELNLSEAVFVLPPEDPGHTCRLRIFTPAMELPFAGHPTVGAAIMLVASGALGSFGDRCDIVFEETAGPVPVTIERLADGAVTATLTSPRLPAREAAPLPRGTLATVLTLPEQAMASTAEAAVYSAGVPFLIIPVEDRAALARAQVDLAAWQAGFAGTAHQHLFVVSMADWQRGREVHARMFAPAMGIVEDPATGAATAALAGFLIDRQRPEAGTVGWTIHQGHDMGRPSRLGLAADIVDGRPRAVRVSGQAVMMSRGRFLVPGPARG